MANIANTFSFSGEEGDLQLGRCRHERCGRRCRRFEKKYTSERGYDFCNKCNCHRGWHLLYDKDFREWLASTGQDEEGGAGGGGGGGGAGVAGSAAVVTPESSQHV